MLPGNGSHASLSLSSYLLSRPPFRTLGNRNLVKGNISCCFLPAFFFVPHAFLKVDCIRRERRQLGMQLGTKQRRGAAQEVQKRKQKLKEQPLE